MRLAFVVVAALAGGMFPLLSQESRGKQYSARLIADDTGKPLEGVICTLKGQAGQTLAYAFTDASGTLRIASPQEVDQVSFRLLGYATKSLPADSLLGDRPAVVRLSPAVEQLREVVVSSEPIRQRGDTIQYQVGSFKGRGDRVIADVLRKLPGIKVSDTGQILYQGEAINHFYVEGRDLMGGQYGLVTSNLSADAVSSVEVLERNQHIKALKNIDRPRQAAVNLRLKQGFRFKPFGEVSLLSGIGDGALYGGNAMLANFSAGIQLLGNLKGNNMGELLLSSLDNKIQTSDLDASLGSARSQLLSIPQGQSMPLHRERYTFGSSHIASARVLLPLDKDRELKVNFSYGRDRTDQEYKRWQRLFLGKDSLLIDEEGKSWGDERRTSLSLDYEENRDDRYFTSRLSYQGKDSFASEDITQETNRLSYGEQRTNLLRSRNRLIYNLKDKQTLSLILNATYSQSSERMSLEDATDLGIQFRERFRQEALSFYTSASSSVSLWGGRLSLRAEADYNYRNIAGEVEHSTSRFLDGLGDSQLAYHGLRLGLIPQYQYDFLPNSLILTLALPLHQTYHSFSREGGETKQESLLYCAPRLSLNYTVNHLWNVYISLGGGEVQYQDTHTLLPKAYLQGYRSLYNPSGDLEWSKSYYSGVRIKYQNLLTLLFGNLNVMYSHRQNTFTPEYTHSSRWSLLSSRPEASPTTQIAIGGDISKGFWAGRMTLTWSPQFSRLQRSFVQQGIWYRSMSQLISSSLEANFRLAQSHQLGYVQRLHFSRSKSGGYSTPWLRGMKQKLTYSFTPTNQWELGLDLEHNLIEQSRSRRFVSYVFGDLSARYKGKRIELELRGKIF